jgi:pyruvate/2-oxoglutarate dehydrogenase complex dihydrolipoamide dehydrogenase (E3) component
MKPEYDLCVIGGGAAGLVVAAGGAGLGAKVVLVEQNRLGGDCLYYGCVPSKALLKAANVFRQQQDGNRFGLPGVQTQGPVSIPDVMRRVQEVIAGIEPNDSPARFRSLGVEVINARGRFIDPRTFEADGRRLTARRFVLATGSRPTIPDLPGLDRVPFLTNETIFSLAEAVPSLTVIGAGPIGCELAQAFARLGTTVTMIGREPRLLVREDADAAQVVRDALERDGVRFELGATPVAVSGSAGQISVAFERAADLGMADAQLQARPAAHAAAPRSAGWGWATGPRRPPDRSYSVLTAAVVRAAACASCSTQQRTRQRTR